MPCGGTQQLFVRQTERTLSCNSMRKHLENVLHKLIQPDLSLPPQIHCKKTHTPDAPETNHIKAENLHLGKLQ